jgi:hypothetical protein
MNSFVTVASRHKSRRGSVDGSPMNSNSGGFRQRRECQNPLYRSLIFVRLP